MEAQYLKIKQILDGIKAEDLEEVVETEETEVTEDVTETESDESDEPKKFSVGSMVEMPEGKIGLIETVEEDTQTYTIRIYDGSGNDLEATDQLVSIPFDSELSFYGIEEQPKSQIIAKFKSIEVKMDEDEKVGIIEGFASTYGNVDLGGDVVEKGAYTQTLKHKGGKVPLLLDHDYRTSAIAGIGYLEDSPEGLKLRGEMPLDVPEVANAYRKIKFLADRGMKMGLSIGYETIKSIQGDNGVRRLKELSLHEVSITPFPMNTEAVIMSAKAKKFREYAETNVRQAQQDAPEGNPIGEGALALLDELTKTIHSMTLKK
jgi:HK97 family phage prohead protease